MKPRIPARGPRRLRPVDLSFIKKGTFWMYQSPSVIQSIIAPLPNLWLPSFATSMGMSPSVGALAVALSNLASCCGYLLQGRLVDRYHVSRAILVSSIGSTIAVFGVWGCSTHKATLYIFAILFGLFGSGYPGHWTGCASDMRRTSPTLNTGLVISLLCAGKGVGTILAGPVSEKLLSMKPWQDTGLAYGSSYGSIIVLTGVCAFLGGAGAAPYLANSLVTKVRTVAMPRWNLVRVSRTYATA